MHYPNDFKLSSKCFEKSFNKEGKNVYDDDHNKYQEIIDDWDEITNEILENVIKQGGHKIKISEQQKKISQDNLSHLRKLDTTLEEAGLILSIKRYLFDQGIKGRITDKDILNFLRKKMWKKYINERY